MEHESTKQRPENSSLPLPQQQQPQKCPRCESLNTKFCYYNNYSLSQPRYFCKTCRRYWTQGGTLRNVPVGGGCRKGKRAKPPSSSSFSGDTTTTTTTTTAAATSSRSHPSPVPPASATSAPDFSALNSLGGGISGILDKEIVNLGLGSGIPPPPLIPSFYGGGASGGGFLSSLSSLMCPSQIFNQRPINQFGGSSSNLSLLQGLINVNNVPPLMNNSLPGQIHHHPDFFQSSGNRDDDLNLVQSSTSSRPSNETWTRTFINSATTAAATTASPPPSTANFWSSTATTTTANPTPSTANFWSSTTSATANSLNPTSHWPDLSDYGSPP